MEGTTFHRDFPLEWWSQGGNLALVLLVIHHMRKGKESFWEPFISTLPTEPPAQISERVFVFSRNEVYDKFEYFQPFVPDLTFDEFFWAYSVVYTRLFDDLPWWKFWTR